MKPSFEVTTRPWHGPKARAKQALASGRESPLPPQQTFTALRSEPRIGNRLQHVRFIDYVERPSGTPIRIAICNLLSDPESRQQAYEIGFRFAKETGWYVLPAGERLGSRQTLGTDFYASEQLSWVSSDSGGILSFASGCSPENGSSIEITLKDNSTIFFDTGFRWERSSNPLLTILSHAHRDHCGALRDPECPPHRVLLTKTTLRMLRGTEPKPSGLWRHKFFLIRENEELRLSEHLTLATQPVPHFPGSIAIELRDGKSSVLYSGDICLESARHRFELATSAADIEPSRRWVLLDGTMAGRNLGANSSSDPAAEIVQAGDSRAVICESPEQAALAYIDCFHTAKSDPKHRESTSFVCDAMLRSVFQVLHENFLVRKSEGPSPFILSQYGASRSAWGESRSLYWSDTLDGKPPGRVIYFGGATPSSEAFLRSHEIREGLFVGRASSRPAWISGTEISASPWGLHSDEPSLAKEATRLSQLGYRIALFHNFPKRLERFARAHNLDAVSLRSVPVEVEKT